jgi:outer membrane biosynthesis protein TonB
MQFGIIFSTLLHGAVLALFMFGISLPHKDLNTDYAITIDLVKPSEISNLKIANKPKTKKQVKTEVNSVPKASTEKSEPEPEKKEEKPQEDKQNKPDDSEAIPEKKKPIVEEEKKKEEKKPKKKPDEKKKPPKKEADDFSKAILKSLEKSTKQQKQVEKKPIEKVIEEETDGVKGDTNQEYKSDLPLSLSEVDAIKSEVTRHWNTSAFSGSASASMQVTVVVNLDPMGNVTSVKVEKALNSSPSYHAFVSSVVRAIKMSDFASILSPENYGSWNELELRFDSSGMIY